MRNWSDFSLLKCSHCTTHGLSWILIAFCNFLLSVLEFGELIVDVFLVIRFDCWSLLMEFFGLFLSVEFVDLVLFVVLVLGFETESCTTMKTHPHPLFYTNVISFRSIFLLLSMVALFWHVYKLLKNWSWNNLCLDKPKNKKNGDSYGCRMP